MRIPDSYKRAGFFWLPSNPAKKVPGTLSTSDGGRIALEIVGLFRDGIGDALNSNDGLERIVGQVEVDGMVTLENCFYVRKTIAFGGIATSLIHASLLLTGVAYDDGEPIALNTASFSIEGLDEWLGVTGICVDYAADLRTATIRYTPPETLEYELGGGFRLQITHSYTLPGVPVTTEAKVTQRAYFKLLSETARQFSDFVEILHKISYLLCFAVDATVAIRDVTVTSNSIATTLSDGRRRQVPIKAQYESLPFATELPPIAFDRMLFSFGQIREHAGQVFNRWLAAYAVIRPSLGLYFSAATGSHKFLEGRFLALAQALETYHRRTSRETLMDTSDFRSLAARVLRSSPKDWRRWLHGRLIHGNEINFGLRIKRIIEPFKDKVGNSKERTKLIRRIVDTRNYLTHYSERLESRAAKGAELWDLCQKVEAIFQLLLLIELGFSDDEIAKVLTGNYRLKQKLTST